MRRKTVEIRRSTDETQSFRSFALLNLNKEEARLAPGLFRTAC
jgi:hypothetical protein